MTAIFYAFLIVFIMMLLLWMVSLRLRNASIVDPFWGMGFVLTTLLLIFILGWPSNRFSVAMILLLLIWGIRLSVYLFLRNRGKGEDFRYQAFRKYYGEERYGWISLFQVFFLQGAIMVVVMLPVVALWTKPVFDSVFPGLLGVILWGIGFFFEAEGDWQLSRFKALPENKGKLFTRGLWRMTRHPNYFGESMIWWGFGLMSLSSGHYWALISPVLMNFLLLRVSGVSMLEKTMKTNKPGYED